MPSSHRLLTIPLLLLLAVATRASATQVPRALPGAPAFSDTLRAQIEKNLEDRGSTYEPRSRHRRPDGSPIYSNRLLLEASPYLQQHAHNPVNWFPWGEAAFAEAKRLNRPVLVSIGYSTCHWCHVMEEETFDSTEIAAYLNAHFIAIKVDREARPDVDSIYMAALQAMGQRGGWPLNVWLTPEAAPFFGGTYFPPEDRGGRPGFMSVLVRISERFEQRPDLIEHGAAALTKLLREDLERRGSAESRAIGEEVLAEALSQYQRTADRTWGGIGARTKFPSSLPIRLLLREYRRTQNADVLSLAILTLEKMASGGIHDQLGGGFHRYSTDPRWLVPHFEKMLYDNALISIAYLEAGQISGRADFMNVARTTLDYVLGEMTDPDGAFYSATDADSRTPAGRLEEGWFFTWTPQEIEQALGEKRARLPIRWFGVSPGGQQDGRSVLHTWLDEADVATRLDLSPKRFQSQLTTAKRDLYAARANRAAPARDEKILAAWNGLMIGAFARAGFVLGEPGYIDAARRAAVYVLEQMRNGEQLHSVSLHGRAAGPAFLEDYAFLISGLLDLFEASSETRWLESALVLQRVLDSEYLDTEAGGYFRTAQDQGVLLIAREKPARDGALPSGNSVEAANLLRLATLTDDDRLHGQLTMLQSSLYEGVREAPTSLPELLGTVSDQRAGMREIVLVIPESGGNSEPMLRSIRETFIPNRVLVIVREGAELDGLEKLVPWVATRRAIGGRVTAYVCEDRVCQYPTDDPARLRRQLDQARKPLAMP